MGAFVNRHIGEERQEWPHEFFGGSADFYGTVYNAMGVFNDEKTEQEIEGLLSIFKPGFPSHILDWCGGWGRHAVPLAKRGFKVTLLDFSKEYLERAEAYAKSEGVSLNLVHADFRETPASIQADYAINMFTAGLGYLREDDDIAALKSLHAALKPGARIFIDTMNLFWIIRNFASSSCLENLNGTKWRLERRKFDFLTNRIHSHDTYLDTGGWTEMRRDHDIRSYSAAELARVLEKAGFTPSELFGGFDGSEFSLTSKRLMMTALCL